MLRELQSNLVDPVRLLYVCDFPPSNLGGGPILMSRLLKEYSSDSLTVLTSKRYARISPPEGRLDCEQNCVALSEGYGRFGLGRLRIALNWLRIPLIALTAIRIIRRRRIAAILTVLHGYFHFVATLAARLTGIPYVVIVHDDYTCQMNTLVRQMTRAVLRNAARIYCVSPGMQETVRLQFGVESELQRPASEKPAFAASRQQKDELSIVFAGSITAAVEDSLRALAELIVTGKLKESGIPNAKLHLYTVVRDEQKRAWGWDHADIVIHSWVGQNELVQVLRNADILFLPFSFAPSERHTVETAFPSKTADYLASGTPILIFGPEYSSLVGYARREGFGEIVSDRKPELLIGAIRRLTADPECRQMVMSRSLQVFSKYHDICRQRVEFSNMLQAIAGAQTSVAGNRR